MEIKILFALIVVDIAAVSFVGFIHRWSWSKIVKHIIVTSLIIAPTVLLDNYRIFVIAIFLAVVFEIKNRSS